MENDKDKIINALETEIIRLKVELIIIKDECDAIKKQFDELKVILRDTWNQWLIELSKWYNYYYSQYLLLAMKLNFISLLYCQFLSVYKNDRNKSSSKKIYLEYHRHNNKDNKYNHSEHN